MNEYRKFIFKDYSFDLSSKTLSLRYDFDDALTFNETYSFNFDFVEHDSQQLDRALQNLFFMAGVSYYKMYLAKEVEIQKGQLDDLTARFFAKTYQLGLGEFFYVNNLDPQTPIVINPTTEAIEPLDAKVSKGLLIGVGGGKDSLVSIELLRDQPRVATWSLGHEDQLAPLVKQIGLPHFDVQRQWDQSLLEHNKRGALNGHVPISAIIACVGTIASILTGYSDQVVSNENSTNEATLEYQGVSINHQYSKSSMFENDYQEVLRHDFNDALHYYSFLRPLSELYIAELFANYGFEKYKNVFSSCNRAYVHTSHALFWCGECPKCAFVFLALTPFVDRYALESLWHGKNLLLDPGLEGLYRNLLGIEGEKPLECVGEIKESRAAMRLAQKIYPELMKYIFELPDNYDYRQLAPHHMPEAIFSLLQQALVTTQ
jgi:hypothetical protein